MDRQLPPPQVDQVAALEIISHLVNLATRSSRRHLSLPSPKRQPDSQIRMIGNQSTPNRSTNTVTRPLVNYGVIIAENWVIFHEIVPLEIQ